MVGAAREVMPRLIGGRAQEINIEFLPTATNSLYTYEIEASNGNLTIWDNSSVALTFGFYQYLKKAINSMVS